MGAKLCCLVPCSESYSGEWSGREKHGLGLYTYASGEQYEGMFHRDKRQGHGVYRYESGAVYEGEFHHDCRHGEGRMIWSDGAEYVGTFEDDMQQGKGTLTAADGSVYKGSWQANHEEGFGEKTWPDGVRYIGEFSQGRFHGAGKVFMTNGDLLEGDYVAGTLTGPARLHTRDGSTYTGVFDTMFADTYGAPSSREIAARSPGVCTLNGKGTLMRCDGCVYQGYFRRQLMHGRGEFRYPNGDIYTGMWIDDLIQEHLVGVMKYVNGDVYTGVMVDRRKQGQGTLVYATGDTYEGQFFDDVRDGVGKCTYANGDTYNGSWRQDRRNGQGTYHDTGQHQKYVGLWNDDMKHGEGTLYYDVGESDVDEDLLLECDSYHGVWNHDRIHHPSNNLRIAAIKIRQQQISRLSTLLRSEHKRLSTIDPSLLCRLCLRNVINTVYLECAHRIACHTCTSAKSFNNTCIQCKSPVTQIIRTIDT